MFIGQICYCACSFATSRRHLTYVGLLKKRARMRRGRQPSIHSIRSRPGPRIETREKPMTSSLPLAWRHRKRTTGGRASGEDAAPTAAEGSGSPSPAGGGGWTVGVEARAPSPGARRPSVPGCPALSRPACACSDQSVGHSKKCSVSGHVHVTACVRVWMIVDT